VAQHDDLKLPLTASAGKHANETAQEPIEQRHQHDAQSDRLSRDHQETRLWPNRLSLPHSQRPIAHLVLTGTLAETFDQHSFVAGIVITPLALVGGVFYSARRLGEPWETLTRFDPIYYLVDATRAGMTGFHESPVWISLAVVGVVSLAAFAVMTAWVARLAPQSVTRFVGGYPGRVDLARLRGRMPLVVFILLAVVCLALLGFACACLTDQPTQAIDRASSLGSALPPLIEVWSFVFVTLMGASFLVAVRERASSRASPALLQRFLF